MPESGREDFRSGDALVVFDAELRVLAWNSAAEELTGVPAWEAIGRPCWEVLGGVDSGGSLVCHARCSNARLAREGWPVATRELLVKTRGGRRRVSLSTLAIRGGERPLYLHLMRNGLELAAEDVPAPRAEDGNPPALTRRQLEVLELLAAGVPAKAIADRLGLAETTVRNHIHAILLELGCHSQLQAVAKARRWRLL